MVCELAGAIVLGRRGLEWIGGGLELAVCPWLVVW